MRIASTFSIAAALLLAGLSVGAWRVWHATRSDQPLAGSGAGVVEVSLVTTQSKRDWVTDEVYTFNYTHPQIHVTFKFIESRAAMQSILFGKETPDLWSPDSPDLVTALVDNWSKIHGTSLVDTNDPEVFRVFQRSPIVFLTTKEKAVYLRPILGGPKPWEGIRKLGNSPKSTPWGRFTFRHADPTNDATGLLMLALILNEYVADHGQTSSLESVAKSDVFGQYLAQVERGLSRDAESQSGTFNLTKSYVAKPSTTDFILTTESSALAAAVANPDLAVIYPNPTAVTEESVCVLHGPWLTPNKEQAALQFMQYISQSPAAKSGLKLYMRPANSAMDSSVSPRLAQHSSQGFSPTYSSIELPSYSTLNAALFEWCKDISHSTYVGAQ